MWDSVYIYLAIWQWSKDLTHLIPNFRALFIPFFFLMEKDVKMLKTIISTSERTHLLVEEHNSQC